MYKKVLWLILFFFFSTADAATQKYVSINIQGVTCPFCVKVLINNIKALPNVNNVNMSEDNQKVVIEIKPNKEPNLELITQTIQKSGYTTLKTEVSSLKPSTEGENIKVIAAHMNIQNQPCGSCHNKEKK